MNQLSYSAKRENQLIRLSLLAGGAKNETWLQMQADIFNTRVVKLENEQGPAMGAAMLAAFGSGWFDSLEECAEQFIHEAAAFYPKEQNVQKYKTLFELYKNIYVHTKDLNTALKSFRQK